MKRWTHQELVSAIEINTQIFVTRAKSKYSNYGLVAITVIEVNVIRQFVMSCSVIGLDLEVAMIIGVAKKLLDQGHNRVDAQTKDQ
ncbi:MAG: putative enzyme involved in methoxymalonyl-ACP biosynthesis [Candidatus Azotimanducaceae bacterium]